MPVDYLSHSNIDIVVDDDFYYYDDGVYDDRDIYYDVDYDDDNEAYNDDDDYGDDDNELCYFHNFNHNCCDANGEEDNFDILVPNDIDDD